MEVRIYYEDTDCGGVVYYANYLKYFERARTEYIRDKGIDLAKYMEEGFLFTVARTEVDYKAPAVYGDLLDISTEMAGLTKASFTFFHSIKRKKDGRLIVQGMAKLVCVKKNGRPTRLPEKIWEKLEKFN